MRTLVTGPLAGWVGRLLLLGAVLFWWGGVVVPNLVSLAFPGWLAPESIPRDLNPDIDYEGRLANRVSTAALLVLGVLALLAAVVSRGRGEGRLVVGEWTLLSGTALVLGWEETTEVHSTIVPAIGSRLLGVDLIASAGPYVWVLLVSPLIAAFAILMGIFWLRGMRSRSVRAPFALGLAAWLFALLCEAVTLAVFRGRASDLMLVMEETLEFGGTLLIAVSAASALTGSDSLGDRFGERRITRVTIGSTIAVLTVGVLFVGLVYRVPLVDSRATAGHATYWVSLENQQSLAQGFGMPAGSVSRLSVPLANRDLEQRSGMAIWRVLDAIDARQGSVLREGRVEVPAGDLPAWTDIDVPLLTAGKGRRLFLQVVADIGPTEALRVGMVKGDRFADGRLWVNGELTWPDQDLEFVAHGAAEPTRSKAQSLWRLMTSDWQWPVAVATAAVALTMVTLVPVLLIAALWPKPRVSGIPSGLR